MACRVMWWRARVCAIPRQKRTSKNTNPNILHTYINVVEHKFVDNFEWLIVNQMPVLYYDMHNHNILWMQPICVRSDGFQ